VSTQIRSLSHRRRIWGGYTNKLLGYGPDVYWPLSDASGIVGKSLICNTAIENLVANPGFEYTGGANWTGWVERVGTGAIADEGVIVHSGSHAAKLTRGADSSTWIYQYIKVIPGETLALSLYARGDGTNEGRYAVYDYNNSAWITPMTVTGVAAAAYAEVTDTIDVPATCNLITLYLAVPTTGGLCYFDDISITGVGTLDGAYVGSGITLGQPGIGDGNPAAHFDGNNTTFFTGSQRFNAVWDGDVGTAIAWGCIAAADWTDTDAYRYLFHPKSMNDAHYYVVFGKADVAHRLIWRRKAGAGKNVNEQSYTFAPTGPDNTWFCMGYTWDINVPNLRGYLYAPGVLDFTEVFDVAGADMDAWGDHPVTDQSCVMMAGGLSGQEFEGKGAHIAYWAGRAFTAAQMQDIMTLLA
jgi:hypothetical protein